MPRWTATFDQRFWSRVTVTDPDRCWPYTGALTTGRRGNVWAGVDGVTHTKAPRAAYYLCHGYWPTQANHISPECDNPNCCNPLHIYDGTQRENLDDIGRDSHGRFLRRDA